MIWQIAGVVGAITVPLYGLVIFLIRSYSTMNREIGELKKDVERNAEVITRIESDIKQNSEAIGRVEASVEDIKRSSSWEPSQES